MNKIYAGIGSRKTPPNIIEVFQGLAVDLGKAGWTLRSGGALGADQAFEAGAESHNLPMELYIPDIAKVEPLKWFIPGDCSNAFIHYGTTVACKVIAKLLHPKPQALSAYALELHARNTYQILGADLNTPCDVVICWTPNGDGSGGTGQALRLANLLNIPVIDFGCCKTQKEIDYWCNYIKEVYGL